MIEVEQALELIANNVKPLAAESGTLANAVGRVLAQDVVADVDSPPHTKSVMDGFAVRAEDVNAGGELRVVEIIVAGDVPQKAIEQGTCSRIMTGAPLPKGSDAVVMVECSSTEQREGSEFVRFEIDSLQAGQHTMARAASFAQGETIFPAGHVIRPWDIGLLAEVGASSPPLFHVPTAAVLATGNELVDSSEKPAAGQIRNSNGPMLLSMLKSAGVHVKDLGIGRDNKEDLRKKIATGLKDDLLVLTGGVSAGVLDLVPSILVEAGVDQVFHKVRVKPGKPIWFGVRRSNGDRTLVFGLPGNPVSSLVGFQLFVKSALRRMANLNVRPPILLDAELSVAHETRGNRPTYWPGCWAKAAGSGRKIEPLVWLGSSDLRTLGKAEALILFPAGTASYEAGQTVQVLPITGLSSYR